MSKKGKFSVQNWQSDPMNSPKAFGELIMCSFTDIFLEMRCTTKLNFEDEKCPQIYPHFFAELAK